MGFIVDAFVGEQQIVIKPLGSHLRKVSNVAGVTILGAGEVVPILNVPDLMTHARTRSGQRVGMVQRDEHEGPRSVLICEDSFTTRELERSIFEAAGYVVETANDGAQGLALLEGGSASSTPSITDVQMPNMTGFELTRAIKGDPALAEISGDHRDLARARRGEGRGRRFGRRRLHHQVGLQPGHPARHRRAADPMTSGTSG